jgi:predicted N-formylglutamate amidohydrolase
VVENLDAAGRFVIVCDHAYNRIPDDFETFGFGPESLKTHIAWDPGNLGVARHLIRSLTVTRHACPRGLPATMIEIRTDEITDEAGERRWIDRLASILLASAPSLATRFESCM